MTIARLHKLSVVDRGSRFVPVSFQSMLVGSTWINKGGSQLDIVHGVGVNVAPDNGVGVNVAPGV
jgi:hypothetical protein